MNLSPELYFESSIVFILFCVIHSFLASHKIKSSFFKLIPAIKPWYRILYNLISLGFLLVWANYLPRDTPIYWAPDILFFLMLFFQFIFAVLFISTIVNQNGMTFLGIRQMINKLMFDSDPEYLDEPKKGSLVKSGFYKYLRHPMYTFAMLALILSPVMTANLFYSIVSFAIYFWIGSYFEEKNLIKRFGDEYRIYQREVPKFIPNFFS
jgi:methanethiol S-methyltransferase